MSTQTWAFTSTPPQLKSSKMPSKRWIWAIFCTSQYPLQGDIIRIDRQGKTHYAQFASADPYIESFYRPRGHVTQREYFQALKTMAVFHGFDPEEINRLLADGYTAEDVGDLIYCGRYL